MRVLRRRILKVPKPRTSMLCCALSASFTASRNASTTRAQSFFEIIGPAVRAIEAVTCSTRSALVMHPPGGSRMGGRPQAPRARSYELTCCLSRAWGLGARGAPKQGEKLGEVRVCVVRPRSRLRMVLHGEKRKLQMPHPFDGAVIEVDVRDLERRRS